MLERIGECMDKGVELIRDDVNEFRNEFDTASTILAILYFTAFAGLIFSVCLMGVNGDWTWGLIALINAVVILVIGFVTGIF